MNIRELWNSNNHRMWKEAEDEYQSFVSEDNRALEEKLANISIQKLKMTSAEEFYKFLYNDYFKWKYTAKNRLATTRTLFEYYKTNNNIEELALIKNALFTFDTNNILLGLKIANLIKGLGCAGASGLLSILFPDHYGTVDQFVVKSLLNTEKEKDVKSINPDSIKLDEAVILEEIMINKAKELNLTNNTTYWTPRKIDKVLWSKGHTKKLFSEYPELKTNRLIIKKIEKKDIKTIKTFSQNDKIYKYLPTGLPERQGDDFLYTCEKLFKEKTSIVLGIYLTEQHRRFCGIAEIYHYDPSESKVTIGYRLDMAFWGKGFATEIVHAIVEYLFMETDIKAVCASNIIDNPSSGRVLEKNGFKCINREVPEDWGFEDNVVVDKWCCYKSEYRSVIDI